MKNPISITFPLIFLVSIIVGIIAGYGYDPLASAYFGLSNARQFARYLFETATPQSPQAGFRFTGTIASISHDSVSIITTNGQAITLPTRIPNDGALFQVAIDSDQDIPVKQEAFTAGSDVTVTASINLTNGEYSNLFFELNK